MPRRRVVSRPPLPRRAIVWFPPAELVADVERFRALHDPLARALRAHVTLVFPFASTLGAVQVAAHVRRATARWPALPVRLERLGHFHADWVYLRMTRGHAAVTALHDRLYRGALAPFLRPEFPYEPHLTIGRAKDAQACDRMLETARLERLDRPRDAVMRIVTICTLHDDGQVSTEAEFPLG
jgi:2'-5' RNA ligase